MAAILSRLQCDCTNINRKLLGYNVGEIDHDKDGDDISMCMWKWQVKCDDLLLLQTWFVAATKQLYVWYFLSVCPSVTPFWLCWHHRIIMKFSGVITKDQGKVHAKGQGQRSKVKVTEVTTQLNYFRTVTPVWIHIWWWNDTYSLVLPCCFSRSSVKF